MTSGRIRRIAVAAAERAPGVLAVITHVNAPALAPEPMTPLGPSPAPPFAVAWFDHWIDGGREARVA